MQKNIEDMTVEEVASRIEAQKWREVADNLAEILRIFSRKPLANTSLRDVVTDALQAYDEAASGEEG